MTSRGRGSTGGAEGGGGRVQGSEQNSAGALLVNPTVDQNAGCSALSVISTLAFREACQKCSLAKRSNHKMKSESIASTWPSTEMNWIVLMK